MARPIPHAVCRNAAAVRARTAARADAIQPRRRSSCCAAIAASAPWARIASTPSTASRFVWPTADRCSRARSSRSRSGSWTAAAAPSAPSSREHDERRAGRVEHAQRDRRRGSSPAPPPAAGWPAAAGRAARAGRGRARRDPRAGASAGSGRAGAAACAPSARRSPTSSRRPMPRPAAAVSVSTTASSSASPATASSVERTAPSSPSEPRSSAASATAPPASRTIATSSGAIATRPAARAAASRLRAGCGGGSVSAAARSSESVAGSGGSSARPRARTSTAPRSSTSSPPSSGRANQASGGSAASAAAGSSTTARQRARAARATASPRRGQRARLRVERRHRRPVRRRAARSISAVACASRRPELLQPLAQRVLERRRGREALPCRHRHRLLVDVEVVRHAARADEPAAGRGIHELHPAPVPAPRDDEVRHAAGQPRDGDRRQRRRARDRDVVGGQHELRDVEAERPRRGLQRVDRRPVDVGLAGLAQPAVADLEPEAGQQRAQRRRPAVHARGLDRLRDEQPRPGGPALHALVPSSSASRACAARRIGWSSVTAPARFAAARRANTAAWSRSPRCSHSADRFSSVGASSG